MRENGKLPNLVIIGAMKCATTSLHYYLGLHPDIRMSREKELNFFVRELNWSRGLEWYRANFSGEAKIYGESSPSYTNYPIFKDVPERIASVLPEAQLIYMVRDPIERIVSHYIHECAAGREERTLAEALADPERSHYVSRSRYFMQLERYLRYFPCAQILIVSQEELRRFRRETVKRVFRFLGVDESFSSMRFSRLKHKSREKRRKTPVGRRLSVLPEAPFFNRLPSYTQYYLRRLFYFPLSRAMPRPSLSENLRAEVVAALVEDARRLKEYAGRGFQGWSV